MSTPNTYDDLNHRSPAKNEFQDHEILGYGLTAANLGDEGVKLAQTVAEHGPIGAARKVANLEADLSRTAGQDFANLGKMNKAMAVINAGSALSALSKETTGFEADPAQMLMAGIYNGYRNTKGFLGGEDDGKRMEYAIGYDENNRFRRGRELSNASKAGMAKAYKTVTGEDFVPNKATDFAADAAGWAWGALGATANSLSSGGFDAVTAQGLERLGVNTEAAGIEKDPLRTQKLLDWATDDSEKPVQEPVWEPQNYGSIEPTREMTYPDVGSLPYSELLKQQEEWQNFDQSTRDNTADFAFGRSETMGAGADYGQIRERAKTLTEQFGKVEGEKQFRKEMESVSPTMNLGSSMEYLRTHTPWRPDYQLPRDHPLVKNLSEEDRNAFTMTSRKQAMENLQRAKENGDVEGVKYHQRIVDFHNKADAVLKADFDKRLKEQKSRKSKK